jgi:rod shape-determining protein MreC
MLFYKTLNAFTSQEHLLQENQRLKAQLIFLKLHQQRFLDLERENRRLRLLLNSTEKLKIAVKVAEVLFVAAGDRSSEWVLNAGKQEGVYIGQAVLDAQGILGQIIMVGPKTSRVMLINDARSSIPVESLKTGLRSMLQGNGVDHNLSLVFIPKTEKIARGDVLVSSGVGERFPKGYPVGKIIAVESGIGDQFLSIHVMPIAQLNHERFVLLVEQKNV